MVYSLRVEPGPGTNVLCNIYRPQRSWAKVIFLHACVCPQGGKGVCLSACCDAHPPWTRPAPPQEQTPHPREQTPPDQAHSPWEQTPRTRHPPGADPPWSRHPPGTRHTPWEQTPPGPGTPPDQAHPPTPPGSRLQHMVNEQPVRILLECILVYGVFTLFDTETDTKTKTDTGTNKLA